MDQRGQQFLDIIDGDFRLEKIGDDINAEGMRGELRRKLGLQQPAIIVCFDWDKEKVIPSASQPSLPGPLECAQPGFERFLASA